MAFTWEQEVALCLIQRLLDPELVIYFLGILKPLRNEFVFQDAKAFHCSLRLTMGDRKKRLAERKERGEFHLMDPGVPITFPLPLNGVEWRNMRNLFKKIRFFVEGFMYTEIGLEALRDADGFWIDRDQLISEKIETIEKLIYGRNYSCIEFERANKDYIDCMSETEYGVMKNDEYPNLLTMANAMWAPSSRRCIILG